MRKAEKGCRSLVGAAVQLEVAAAAAMDDQRKLLVSRGSCGANQKLICCSEPVEWILGAPRKFGLFPATIALSHSLDWWRSQEGGGDDCGGTGML